MQYPRIPTERVRALMGVDVSRSRYLLQQFNHSTSLLLCRQPATRRRQYPWHCARCWAYHHKFGLDRMVVYCRSENQWFDVSSLNVFGETQRLEVLASLTETNHSLSSTEICLNHSSMNQNKAAMTIKSRKRLRALSPIKSTARQPTKRHRPRQK